MWEGKVSHLSFFLGGGLAIIFLLWASYRQSACIESSLKKCISQL